MRISKDLAQQIAYKLTKKSYESVEALMLEYREVVTVLYESETPEAVKATFAMHPEWFHTRSKIAFTGHGFTWTEVISSRPVISNTNNQDAHLTLTAKIADKITKYKTKWAKAKKECEQLKAETEQALLNLRTFNQIRENIPAAEPFLPPPMSNSLVVNVDSLNKKLKHQPEVKKTNQPA